MAKDWRIANGNEKLNQDWQWIRRLVLDWLIDDQSRIGNGKVLDWQRIGAQVVQGLQQIN